MYKDGLRYTKQGPIQRYLCRDCGYRFTLRHKNSKNHDYNIENDAHRKAVKLLVEAEKQIEKRVAGATEQQQNIQGKIIEFLWHLKKEGRSQSYKK